MLSVARELGLSVPGDLAVVGYDNTSYCDLAQNALTSIDQSGQVLGLQSARLLIERIKGRGNARAFRRNPAPRGPRQLDRPHRQVRPGAGMIVLPEVLQGA